MSGQEINSLTSWKEQSEKATLLSSSVLPGTEKRLSPEAITRQTKYTEFINSAMRVFHTANKKFVLYKNGSRPAQVLMGEVQDELQRYADKVNELLHEILMFSSAPVKDAAGEVAGWVLAAQTAAMLPTLEAQSPAADG